MSKQISAQASKLKTILFDPATTETYRQALTLTWQILRETGVLLWLVICLVLVVFDWFWNSSIDLGRRARDWFDTLEQRSPDNLAKEVGTALMTAGKTSVAYTLSQARGQLGLPEKAEPTLESLPAAKPSSSAPPVVKAEPASAPPVSPPPASTPAPVATNLSPATSAPATSSPATEDEIV